MAHFSHDNSALLARVRRIGGQVNAVERAMQGDANCAEILQLVAAVRGAVNGLLDEIIADHLAAHVAAPGLS
ncbi:metal/formaldehyde-sensitive transcriptional repressor, partial [Escherichia coli]|uniref:metal/formaldehyde-sensitive transcriptional repressor n=3 Tax=Pseudomonadota TaxID=1224 RepID=UPI0013D4445C